MVWWWCYTTWESLTTIENNSQYPLRVRMNGTLSQALGLIHEMHAINSIAVHIQRLVQIYWFLWGACTLGQFNLFWINASNSMGDRGQKIKCMPIFIEFWPRLTKSPKLRRSPDIGLIVTRPGTFGASETWSNVVRIWQKLVCTHFLAQGPPRSLRHLPQKNWTGLMHINGTLQGF